MTSLNASRRLFTRQLGALSTLGAAAPMALNLAAMGSAAAQTASDYRALVCVFLYGGNDSFNTVLPTDTSSWANYRAARGVIALGGPGEAGGVLPINPANPQGRSFALHPQMAALQALFNSATDKRLAVVANVGPLIVPLATPADYANTRKPKPTSLGSHNDQQNVWQSLKPEGVAQGWGGRLADYLAAGNGDQSVFTSISASGNAVWLTGQNVLQYQVGAGGAVRMGGGQVFGSDGVTAAMNRIVTASRGGHVLERDLAALSARSIRAEAVLRSRFPAETDAKFGGDSALLYDGAVNDLAAQLRIVARMIEASRALGVKRQVFFVSMGGFDTHAGQALAQPGLLGRVAHGLSYFDATLGRMSALDNVTTFTASDFGRALTSNGRGTDHGWGGHHFVMGGAVKGGDIYGKFPVLGPRVAGTNLFDSTDQLDNGMLLPKISIDQYGATLARWFGVTSPTDLGAVFTNLSHFDEDKRNLGFMTS